MVKMIASLPHLRKMSTKDVKIDGGIISIRQDLIRGIATADFREMVGSTECNLLRSHPYYYEERADFKNVPTAIAENASTFLTDYLTCLWLIKDNACNAGNFFVVVKHEEEQTFYGRQNLIFCNCFGEYQPTEFSDKELKMAMSYHRRLSQMYKIENQDDGIQLQEDLREHQFSYKARGIVIEDSLHILARTFPLIQQARSAYEIPLKISNYIIILECLFSYENTEVSYRVSERAAFFLAANTIERLEIFETVKQAYTVRSAYVHGQVLPRKENKAHILLALSQRLDQIVRRTFIKYMKEHSKLGLSDESLRRRWLRDLVFKRI